MLFSKIELYICSIKTALNYMNRYIVSGDKSDLQIYNSCFYISFSNN